MMKRSIQITCKLIFFACLISNSVFAQIGQPVQSFPSPENRPTGLTWDGQNLWIADIGTNRIYKLNPANGTVISSISGPVDATINGLAWDGTDLWCSDNGDANKIYRLDKNNGNILQSISLSSGSPRGITFDGTNIWFVDSGDQTIYKLNPATGEVRELFRSPGGYNRGLCWDGKYLWCSDRDKNEIYLIDTLHQAVFQIIDAPGTYSYGLAYDGEFIWNVDYNTDTIYKIQITGTDKYKLYDSLKVKIRYSVNIKNVGSSSMDLETYIACPIDLLYQKLDSSLEFKETPESYSFDKYGQEIAYYQDVLPVNAERNYQYSVPVTLQNIRYFLHPDSVGYLNDIPQSVRDFYTTDEEMYLITNPSIVSAVQEALGGETNFYWQVRKIHDYVIEHVEYLSEGGWNAAPTVLARGTGSCSEYTFLFIAMCRAAGIPARFEAGGHLRDTIPYEDKIFHRWAQVYFPDLGWLPIDCTWDDKEYPCNQARYFGALSTKVFTTTIGAGGDDGLWWTYNSANSTSGGERERHKMMEWLDYNTSTHVEHIIASQSFIMAVNYPNPFSDITTIEYRVSKPSVVKIYIYTNLGKLVRIFDEGIINFEGRVIWDGKNATGTEMNNGIYYYKIKGDINNFTGRMILIK